MAKKNNENLFDTASDLYDVISKEVDSIKERIMKLPESEREKLNYLFVTSLIENEIDGEVSAVSDYHLSEDYEAIQSMLQCISDDDPQFTEIVMKVI